MLPFNMSDYAAHVKEWAGCRYPVRRRMGETPGDRNADVSRHLAFPRACGPARAQRRDEQTLTLCPSKERPRAALSSVSLIFDERTFAKVALPG